MENGSDPQTSTAETSAVSHPTATEAPAPPVPHMAGSGWEYRPCRLCGRRILIVRDANGAKLALDAEATVYAAVRTVRGPLGYDSKKWLAAARNLSTEEVFDGHLRDTLRFAVDHALVCKGKPPEATKGA